MTSSSLSLVFAAEDDRHMTISYEDHHQQQIMHFTSNSSSNSSISLKDPADHDHQEQPKAQYRQFLKVKECVDVLSGGSCDFRVNTSPSPPSLEGNTDYELKLSIFHHGDVEDQRCNKVANNQVNTADIDIGDVDHGGVVVGYKCMPPKMRILKKMMMTNCDAHQDHHHHHQMIAFKPKSSPLLQDQLQQQPSLPLIDSHTHRNTSSSNTNSTSTVRVCADCNTTKTPLWRSGPRGPKSLCNACGIRQRKARRAMMAAAATSTLDAKPSTKVKIKEKKSMVKNTTASLAPYKKACKLVSAPSATTPKQICVNQNNSISIDLSKKKNSPSPDQFHRVFPQDEKEAAILLMALSCGSC